LRLFGAGIEALIAGLWAGLNTLNSATPRLESPPL
jgi:hypothetical protein